MMETLTRSLALFALVVQPMVLSYFLLYNTYRLWLILRRARLLRRRLAVHIVDDLDLMDAGDLTKPLTIIVPAFNEEATIVDTVKRLAHCDYPRFEVVVISDGSSDGTLGRLKQAFRLRRTEVPYRPAIRTSRVVAMYEATVPLPPSVMRLVVIEKESGGRADALNTGINASLTPYFVSVDTESILDRRALKQLMRVIQEDCRVVAVGGQIALAKGCTIRNSPVVSAGLPTRSLRWFHMVEYLRSCVTTGTGLDQIGSMLVVSGALTLFEKETVIRAGGYLTPLLDHRIARQYVGEQAGTVCEDMEIIVRLQRFVLDKLQNRRIIFLPHPVAWTGGPETIASLREQRARRYRGLRKSLRYHSGMLWRARFGSIGWFALPSLWLFEYYGPLIEILGYVSLVFLLIMERVLNYPPISSAYLSGFLLASLGYGALVNVLAVLAGATPVRYGQADRLQRQLLPFRRREVLTLLVYAVLENFGYRQLTLYWRLRGLWEGRKGRERFSRLESHPASALSHG